MGKSSEENKNWHIIFIYQSYLQSVVGVFPQLFTYSILGKIALGIDFGTNDEA